MKLCYEPISMERLKKEYETALRNMKETQTASEEWEQIQKINHIRDHFFNMKWVSTVEAMLDVNNSYWEKQEVWFAEATVVIKRYQMIYFEQLLTSPNRSFLEEKMGMKVFTLASFDSYCSSERIAELEQKESALQRSYQKIITNLTVMWDDQVYTLLGLNRFFSSHDQKVRKKANSLRTQALENVSDEIDELLTSLVKIRNEKARLQGFQTEVDYSYHFMRRVGYGKEEITTFRNFVKETVVPFIKEWKKKHQKRLGLETFYNYDQLIWNNDGDFKLKGDLNYVLEQLLNAYHSIDPRLSSLFIRMKEENWLDLEPRPGKMAGSITTYLPEEQMPLFLSNFNGTSGAVKSLVHEFGHCFQLYSSREWFGYENWWPTFDACETHSLTMELLMMSYVSKFFEEASLSYREVTLIEMLSDLCRISMIDEFQQKLYEHPDTNEERKKSFKTLENAYMPWIQYDTSYGKEGSSYQLIGHIFLNPFYYIDYALATMVALQFYEKSVVDEKATWDQYIAYCTMGGSKTFLESIQEIGFHSPFEQKKMTELIKTITKC